VFNEDSQSVGSKQIDLVYENMLLPLEEKESKIFKLLDNK
jgi:hypothetical protein